MSSQAETVGIVYPTSGGPDMRNGGLDDSGRKKLFPLLPQGSTINGSPIPLWSEAAAIWQYDELGDSEELRRLRGIEPAEPMKSHLGARISDESLLARDPEPSEAELNCLARVVAYPVKSLLSQTIKVEKSSDIAPALRALLAKRIPGLDWWIPDRWEGPFEKYLILHNSIPAPPHSHTGEPMALEIYGHVVHAAGLNLDSEEGIEWWHSWCMNRPGYGLAGDRQSTLAPAGLMTIRIFAATYSNLRFAGVGVGLYM